MSIQNWKYICNIKTLAYPSGIDELKNKQTPEEK